MSNIRNSSLVPAGFKDVVIRTVLTFVIALLSLIAKEYVEAGEFDPAGVSIDAAWIAAGGLVIYSVLAVAGGGSRRSDPFVVSAR